MPEVSRFFGIVITMYIHDHGKPHFHARYGEHLAKYRIEDLQVINGTLPKRVHALVLEWASEHREELMTNWNALQKDEPISKIEGLV
jgi:hypothetical protein